VKDFRAFLEALKIPVLLAWKAIDMIPENHPLYRGRPGGIGQRAANFTQQTSDCVIIIGARLDMPSLAFDHRNFAPASRKVMVDGDLTEIWKMQTPIDIAVHADAGAFLRECRAQAGSISSYQCAPWLETTAKWYRTYPVVLPEYRDLKALFVSTYFLIDVLSDQLRPEDLIMQEAPERAATS
jgi:acetolactate synthase-1/2/3 large subunit